MTFIQATQSAVEFIYTQQMNIQKTQRQDDIKPTETTNYASKSNCDYEKYPFGLGEKEG